VHIIMNPPYDKNLHLKILRTVIEQCKGAEIVNLSPITEIVSLTTKKKTTNFLNGHIESIERVDMLAAQNIFGARIYMDLGIYHLVPTGGKSVKDLDKFALRGKDSIHKDIWNKIQSSECKRFSDFITKPDKLMEGYCVVFNHMSGLTKTHNFVYVDGVAPDGKTYKEHVTNQHKNESTDHFEFTTKEEAENFRLYVNSNIIKFVQSCVNYSGRLIMSAFPFMPTYTHPWTDAELCKYFGLTDEEIKEIEKEIG